MGFKGLRGIIYFLIYVYCIFKLFEVGGGGVMKGFNVRDNVILTNNFKWNFPTTLIPNFSPSYPLSFSYNKNKFYANSTPTKYLIFVNFKWN